LRPSQRLRVKLVGSLRTLHHDDAYELHSPNGRVAQFATARIGYREWAMRTGRINPSVEDRYDHDIDELMA
jgi:hypothetical protein